jgi:hypothetical protein
MRWGAGMVFCTSDAAASDLSPVLCGGILTGSRSPRRPRLLVAPAARNTADIGD